MEFEKRSLVVNIWVNYSEGFGKFYNVTLERRYTVNKEQQQKEWKTSHSLRESDLGNATLLLQNAFKKILELKKLDLQAKEGEAYDEQEFNY